MVNIFRYGRQILGTEMNGGERHTGALVLSDNSFYRISRKIRKGDSTIYVCDIATSWPEKADHHCIILDKV